MSSFKSNGKEWQVEINVAAIRRVASAVGVNLARINLPTKPENETPLLADLASDELLLSSVIYGVIKPQAEKQGITDEQFYEALDGPTLGSASAAFWESLKSFFQSRPDLLAMIAKQFDLMKQVATKVNAINLPTTGAPVSNSPPSPDVTPTPALSEN